MAMVMMRVSTIVTENGKAEVGHRLEMPFRHPDFHCTREPWSLYPSITIMT
jgi:hypothetical protein